MEANIFLQSTLANLLLVFVYTGYKLINRIASSKCHYDGWDVELADPEDRPTSDQIQQANQFFESRKMSLRLRAKDYPNVL